jgi:pentatricopeptide repeat protein
VDAAALAASFDDPSGFAAVMKGMFRNGKAKAAHTLWTSAERRGVHPTVELRFATHDSTGYAVMAFSEHGPIDLSTSETLGAQAERFSLGTLRHEARVYSSLQPHGRHPESPGPHTIDAIADAYPGVHVYTAVTKPKGADRPFVAHCVVDGRDYIYPIPGDRLR